MACVFLLKPPLNNCLDAWEWTQDHVEMGTTYPEFHCNAETDMTTRSVFDKAFIHGSIVIPDLLSSFTANALRDYVLRENSRLDQTDKGISVIHPKQSIEFCVEYGG
jgi:hypothetical protein